MLSCDSLFSYRLEIIGFDAELNLFTFLSPLVDG